MRKRLRLTTEQYDELVQSRDWCLKNGFTGFHAWYMEELEFHRDNRSLPSHVFEAQREVEEERPRGRRRW